jgi:hypothetical protein
VLSYISTVRLVYEVPSFLGMGVLFCHVGEPGHRTLNLEAGIGTSGKRTRASLKSNEARYSRRIRAADRDGVGAIRLQARSPARGGPHWEASDWFKRKRSPASEEPRGHRQAKAGQSSDPRSKAPPRFIRELLRLQAIPGSWANRCSLLAVNWFNVCSSDCRIYLIKWTDRADNKGLYLESPVH